MNGVSLSYEGKVPAQEVLQATSSEHFIEEVHGTGSNLLFQGDNLEALRYMRDQPLALDGEVDFVYIDPPYASNSKFESRSQVHAYTDLLVGAEYLESLRQRLIVVRELMKPSASICVHIDERMSSYVRILLDEVFGAHNFRNEITRVKSNPKNYTSKNFGNVSDRILFYSKTSVYKWNRPFVELEESAVKEYSNIDAQTGRQYKKVPVHAPGVRNGTTGGPWKGMLPPPGKHWQYTPEKLDAMDEDGHIYWSPTGNPRKKIYLDENRGMAVQDVWLDVKDPLNQNAKVTGYPTEKNPHVLERLIEALTDEGDLVLDCYAGSGTALDVAQSLNRRWIGVDESSEAIDTIVNRLRHGRERMGDFRPPIVDAVQPVKQPAADLEFTLLRPKSASVTPVEKMTADTA